MHAIGDEHLGAVDHPLVTLAAGAGADAGHVRARARARGDAAREVRRGRRYDAILLDPPKFGRGPEGEVWDLTADLPALLADCTKLLDADSRFLILTTYAIRLSAIALEGLLAPLTTHLPGTIQPGEMAIREESRGTLLPTAIFARWSNEG
jgi:23S rRNA (cytosine1962-C5)-methyltransferase